MAQIEKNQVLSKHEIRAQCIVVLCWDTVNLTLEIRTKPWKESPSG